MRRNRSLGDPFIPDTGQPHGYPASSADNQIRMIGASIATPRLTSVVANRTPQTAYHPANAFAHTAGYGSHTNGHHARYHRRDRSLGPFRNVCAILSRRPYSCRYVAQQSENQHTPDVRTDALHNTYPMHFGSGLTPLCIHIQELSGAAAWTQPQRYSHI